MVLIITHSKDNDGHFSGAICQYFEETIRKTNPLEINYLRWSYGDKDPSIQELNGYERIYVLDLTLSPQIMEFLAMGYQGGVVWIDHHKANYEKLPDYVHNRIPGTRSDEKAACVLTWDWWLNFLGPDKARDLLGFNQRVADAFPALELDESVFYNTDPEWVNNRVFYPLWLYLIGCYDIWKWNGTELWDKMIIPYEYYLRGDLEDGPKGAYKIIKSYFDCIDAVIIPDYTTCLTVGRTVFKYQSKRDSGTLGNLYKTTVVNETNGQKVNCLVINTLDRGIRIFNGISPELREWTDYFILWNCTGRKYKYSAYSEKDNVFVPDLMLKGCRFGGHPHAGGVVVDKKRLL